MSKVTVVLDKETEELAKKLRDKLGFKTVRETIEAGLKLLKGASDNDSAKHV